MTFLKLTNIDSQCSSKGSDCPRDCPMARVAWHSHDDLLAWGNMSISLPRAKFNVIQSLRIYLHLFTFLFIQIVAENEFTKDKRR